MKNRKKKIAFVVVIVVCVFTFLFAVGASVARYNRYLDSERGLYYSKTAGQYYSEDAVSSRGWNSIGASKNAAVDISDGDYDYVEAEETVSSETNKTSDIDSGVRKIIKDADIDVETEKYDDFKDFLDKEIKKAGGYIESLSEDNNSYDYIRTRSQTVTIRVPADKLDNFINDLSGAGTVTSKNVYVRDITGDYIDTQSRITALETEYDALLAILAKAETVSDLLTVQNRLTEVNAELESCKSKLKTYDELVSYSTLRINVSEVKRESAGEQESFGAEIKRRLSNNLYSIKMAARSFAIWFISSVPYLAIATVAAIVVVVIIKKKIKKKKRIVKNSDNGLEQADI